MKAAAKSVVGGTRLPRGNLAFEAIPAEMKTFRAWVVWRFEERDGKPTKIPYDPLTGRRAKTTDSRTWRRFEEAVAVLEGGHGDHGVSAAYAVDDEADGAGEDGRIQLSDRHGGYDGIGFVFSSGDPFTGIDLDGCRNRETGELEPWAQKIVAASGEGSYAEVSPSGRGVHVIVNGKAPNKKRGRIECYSSERYFTVTGRAI